MGSRVERAAAESPLVASALRFAERAHAGQIRNGSGGMPYIEHPIAVAEVVAALDGDEQTLAAALLHDVVEDSETELEELESGFGAAVAATVAALSDDESIDPYEERKRDHRERVAAAGQPALTIFAADKLSNVRALRRAYVSQGEAVGDEFKAPLDVKQEIWRLDLEMLRREAPGLPILDELETELDAFAAVRAGAAEAPR